MADNYFNASSKLPEARRLAPWQNISDNSITGDTLFEVAADRWLALLSPSEESADLPIGRRSIGLRIRKNTERGYHQHLRTLKLFFGGRAE